MHPVSSNNPAHPQPERIQTAYETVVTAHQRTIDALAGFETMVEKAEPDFLSVAQQFRDLHLRHTDILAGILRNAGLDPDEDGTFMGTINRAVVATRAFFDEIDADVMKQVRRGEENVLAAYRDANAQPLTPSEQQAIAALIAELQTLLAQTQHLS
jgi:hypothetical protein